jgi:hypothetical protein
MMPESPLYLSASPEVAAVSQDQCIDTLVNMSQMVVSETSATSTADSPQEKLHWLSEQALCRSRLPVMNMQPAVFMDGFFDVFSAGDIRT